MDMCAVQAVKMHFLLADAWLKLVLPLTLVLDSLEILIHPICAELVRGEHRLPCPCLPPLSLQAVFRCIKACIRSLLAALGRHWLAHWMLAALMCMAVLIIIIAVTVAVIAATIVSRF
jgi:hypothetical protein